MPISIGLNSFDSLHYEQLGLEFEVDEDWCILGIPLGFGMRLNKCSMRGPLNSLV